MKFRQGHCFVFSAPSGCGKSTIITKLCELDSCLRTSISTTTRPKRAYEIDGEHYCFVSDDQFDELVANDEFLEYATVFKHRYGTRREIVTRMLQNGFDVLFDIDWQGARTIKQQETNVVSFFIIPPTLAELKRRLSTRDQDSRTSVDYRMSRAKDELAHFKEFDYVIVNDALDTTIDRILTCIKGIRHRETVSVPPFKSTIQTLLNVET